MNEMTSAPKSKNVSYPAAPKTCPSRDPQRIKEMIYTFCLYIVKAKVPHLFTSLILPDPLGDGTILLLLLSKFALDAKSFQSGHYTDLYFLLSEKMIILHYYRNL